MATCVLCGRGAKRPKGLCWRCSRSDAGRRLRSESKYARRGLVDGTRGLAPYPTVTLPGSVARMQVYQWRLREGYELFHPDDENGGEGRTPGDVSQFSGKPYSASGPTGLE